MSLGRFYKVKAQQSRQVRVTTYIKSLYSILDKVVVTIVAKDSSSSKATLLASKEVELTSITLQKTSSRKRLYKNNKY